MNRQIRLLVPAAGAGTRIGLPYPKTLYSIAGKPILGYILDQVKDFIDEAVVIVSPAGQGAVQAYLQTRRDVKTDTLVQVQPIGMADAVQVGLSVFRDHSQADYLIIWGDQATVHGGTVKTTIDHHHASGAWLTFPTCWRQAPYTHIVRDSSGYVCGILASREGDHMPLIGENDCGIFLARGEFLLQGLEALRDHTFDPATQRFRRLNGQASVTSEFNFLPLIQWWAGHGHPAEAIEVGKQGETRGINTMADALAIDKMLTIQ